MTRRELLALAAGASAAAAGVAPALALPIGEVDVAVVGSGAAGIAAARMLVRAGLSVLVIEGRSRVGGRCYTDALTFSAPFDRGAHWIHAADVNPLAKLGRDLGFDLYPDPHIERLAIEGRLSNDVETGSYLAAVTSAEEAINRHADRGEDGPATAGLPQHLGEWRGPVVFRLGPYDCGKTLAEISLLDFARASVGPDMFCRPGYGTILATLGRGLPTVISTPVNAVTVEADTVKLDTRQGTLRARAAIVTASTAVIASGGIKFTPGLSPEQRAAFEGLKLGSYLNVGFELTPDAVEIEPDTTLFMKTDSERTFAGLARAGGSTVWYLGTGGIYARELEAAGEGPTVELATEWLTSLFGSAVKDKIIRSTSTGWGRAPLIGGAWSVASPGQAGARAVLRQPHADRVFFAGEACHDTFWGTVGGAWEIGEAAARSAMALIRG